MTKLYRLDRVRLGKTIESAIGNCEFYGESEDDARAQAAAEFGDEWLDPDQATCKESQSLHGDNPIPQGMRGLRRPLN